jgi:DNA repair protein SbcD/Mre11
LHGEHTFLSGHDLTQAISETVSATIADFAHQLDPTIPALLAGHLTVSSGIFSGSEKRAIYGTDPLFLPSQLALDPFDYVALGHLHRYQQINPSEYPAIVYSGSIERIDFGEYKEEKGFCHVTIPQKGHASHTFIPVPTRPFIQINVACGPQDNITTKILEQLAQHDLTNAIIKIIYHLPAHTSDKVDMVALQAACRGAHYIAGIIPIRSHHEPARRLAHGTTTLPFTELLTSYLTSKTQCSQRAQHLLKKTVHIAAEEGISLNNFFAHTTSSECSSDKPETQ